MINRSFNSPYFDSKVIYRYDETLIGSEDFADCVHYAKCYRLPYFRELGGGEFFCASHKYGIHYLRIPIHSPNYRYFLALSDLSNQLIKARNKKEFRYVGKK